MVKLLTVLSLLASGVLLFTLPWVAALVYSTVSVLQPQYIWFWAFDDFSVFRISAGITIVAWLWHALQGNINWSVYGSGQFKGVVGLLIIFYLSTWFTPFETYRSLTSGDLVVSIFTTIAIMYFFIIGLLNKEDSIKFFGFMYIFVTIYYAYWANDHYLSGNWSQFRWGRLEGPRNSPYEDSNVISVVVTIGLAFVMFGIRYFKNQSVKMLLLLSLPFIWHSLILFASRGALLSAACVTLFFAMVVKSKSLNIVLGLGFIAMLVWQGGMLTQRASSTVEQAQSEQIIEEPLNPRLVSWQIGVGLTSEYPLLGVGPQRFQYAAAIHYPETARHVAHNTFLNFSANTGLIAGLIYLSFFWVSYKQFRYVRAHTEDLSSQDFINMSCMGGLVGYFVGAFFLDLIIFEPFYFLLILISANYYLVKKQQEAVTEAKDSIPLVSQQGHAGRVL